MKNSYAKPSVEAVELNKKDVIKTSGMDNSLFNFDGYKVGNIDFEEIKKALGN